MIRDKIFLLSLEEAEKYLADGKYSLFKCSGSKCFWWLRSSGAEEICVVCINYYDYINRHGNHINFCSQGIRPALHINPDYLQILDKTEQGFVLFAGKEWIILNEESGMLLSRNVVGFYPFGKTNNYEKSGIRAYLNGELLNELFTREEQEMIMDTIIDGENSYPAA